jgi:prolipoprotein diacylglyceryltransferase
MYSIFRFGIEFLRADNPRVLAGLTMSQLIGIPLFLIALVILIRGSIKARAKHAG